jgi:pimeloyl-ACP methyl ester carboxylesterase
MTHTNLTRRAALASGVAAAASLARPARAQAAAKTFVLIAGAAGGGWQWRRVADRLERQGCKVFAPTLTGLGERSHLLSKDVGLGTHVADVVNVVRWEGLERLCLVAHSYAGWPCGAALDQIGDKVASIVWLDAFRPEDGRALIDLVAASARQTYEDAAANGALGMPLPTSLSTASVNPRDEALVRAKLTPQPIATYLQTLRYGGGLERIAKKTYVRLPDFANPAFDQAYAGCKADKSWSTAELDGCGHYAMFDAPERLAALLLRAA